jgi:hypothetical protein
MFDKQPLEPQLSGLSLEYRIVQLYSRDYGRREAQIGFNVGQGTQDIGFRNDVSILFTCLPSKDVTLRVSDENGKPTTASLSYGIVRSVSIRRRQTACAGLCFSTPDLSYRRRANTFASGRV